MADSVGVQREAREVIAAALEVSPAGQSFLDDAAWVLAALADAGISVGRWEQVGRFYRDESGIDLRSNEWPYFTTNLTGEWVPVFRRVDGDGP